MWHLQSADAILFDCDGTLADTMPAHYRAWLSVTRAHGLAFDEDRFYALGGRPTRDIIATLAREAGIPVEERDVDRTELYIADEVFLCGTGQELVAVTSVDRLPVADGKPGAMTRQLQAAYESVVRGTTDRHPEWRVPV